MLNVVITGGAGFIGQKLAAELLRRGKLIGPSGRPEEIGQITLFDVVKAAGPQDPRVTTLAGDIGDHAEILKLIGHNTHSVFHLAAIVSSGAEADFEGGYRVNLKARAMCWKPAAPSPRTRHAWCLPRRWPSMAATTCPRP